MGCGHGLVCGVDNCAQFHQLGPSTGMNPSSDCCEPMPGKRCTRVFCAPLQRYVPTTSLLLMFGCPVTYPIFSLNLTASPASFSHPYLRVIIIVPHRNGAKHATPTTSATIKSPRVLCCLYCPFTVPGQLFLRDRVPYGGVWRRRGGRTRHQKKLLSAMWTVSSGQWFDLEYLQYLQFWR